MKLKPILNELFGTISEASLSRLLSKVQTKDFAIISAFRYNNSLKQNRQLNAKLLQFINSKQMGGYSLIGHWKEAPDDVEYKDATEDQLSDTVEESVLFVKPDQMDRDEFISISTDIGKKFNQDAIVIGLSGEGVFLYYRNGGSDNIGTTLTLNKTAQAYSQMRKKKNIPFVFEGILHPINNISRHAFTLKNINYIKE